MLNITRIPAPRVALVDSETGLMSREWFRFFNNIYTIVGANLGVTQIENGGTGLSTAPTNGQLLIGDTVNGYVLNTLNPADGITVTNGAGTITLTNTGVLSFSGGNTGLTPATATNGNVVISGLLNVASGGTNQSSYVDGELLIGNTTGNTLTKSTLTAGTGLTITNGNGAITPSITATGVTALGYGSASNVGTFTVNAQGQLTTAADVSIAINGNQITSGNVSVLYGGTGQTSYTDGQLLIGNSSGNTLTKATLTAGSGVTITNGAGAITINATGSGGTVTSVAALTLGTTGTDLSSTVANGTTTPVITLQVPTASATNRGALSSTDWSTFNGKQAALVSGTNIKTVGGVSLLGAGDVGTIAATSGGTGQSTVTTGDLLYGSATNTWSKLADVGTGNALISGGVGVAPAWGKVGLATHVSGTLPTANGGTGLTSFTTTGVMYGTSSSALATSSKLTWLESSGFLGVGIYPSAPLHIYSTGNPPIFVDQYSTDGNGANYIGRKARGTIASPLAVAADDFIVSMSARGYGTTVMGGANVGLMGYRAAEAFTNTAQGTYFSLGTTPVGTTSRAERIRIFASGGVSIGNTTDPGATNLSVTGTIVSASNIYSSATSSTSMTNGFIYIPAAAGAPTGVPTAVTGKVAMYYDSTNNFFYVYNGAWKKILLA